MTRKPPSETSDQDTHSRRARLVARRHHRRTRIIVGALALAIAGAGAFTAYAVNNMSSKAQAVGAIADSTTPFGAPGRNTLPLVAQAVAPRTLHHHHPLRLYVGGDSLAGSFGPALGDRVGATGIVKTLVDYRVSSGLWSNDIRDWYQRATQQMVSDDPEAVVFIIGTNDTPVVNEVDSNHDGVPDWAAEYRMKIARMMDLFVGPSHRTVFWLGPPTLGTKVLDQGAKAIGDIMREEAAKRAPDVVYLDTYKLFSTEDGSYSRTIVDDQGNEIVARISDGTHFTEPGAQYLARAVFKLLDTRWNISTQADLLHPIGWTLAPGSGEAVPGFSTTPRSRYGSGNNSSGTTTPSETSSTNPATSTTGSSASTTMHTTVSSTAPKTSSSVPSSTTAPKTSTT